MGKIAIFRKSLDLKDFEGFSEISHQFPENLEDSVRSMEKIDRSMDYA